MAPGIWQIAIVILLAVVLFGGEGKIAAVMGDFAKGLTSFRKGLKDEDEEKGESEDDTPAIDTKSDDDKTGG